MDNQQTLTKYLLAFIAGLKHGGVKQAVISSGSRSTPLSVLVARDPEIKHYIDIDERSASFFALGLAKQSQQPVALVCTSGSAAANYFPAVCEAEATNLALIVLTTDRPAELQAVGAPQAMDQVKLYGSHVKATRELALPEAGPTMEAYSHWQGFTMVAQASQLPKGPVQVNIPLREPLLPDLTVTSSAPAPTKLIPNQRCADLSPLAALLGQNGLIIVGEERTPAEAEQLLSLAELLNWPIIGDPLTNLATGRGSANYLHQADLIFQGTVPLPAVILRFGRLPVTKSVAQWLGKHRLPTILVEAGQQFKDQLHTSNYLLDMTVSEFIASVEHLPLTPVSGDWLGKWQLRQRLAASLLEEEITGQGLNHSSAITALMATLKNTDLFVANSNAIRLLDRLAKASNRGVRVYGNRGVNGIDGLNSTAAGICARSDRPLTMLIGDLAFFHDLTGLAMIYRYQLPVNIVLLNNNGGGIFSFLPQHQLPAADFQLLFKTPQNLDFTAVASLYHLDYCQPTTLESFTTELTQTAPRLIEVEDQQSGPVKVWQHLLAQYQQQERELND